MLENHPREQLCFIITQYGRTIIDDPRRCRGLLKDLAPNHKRETTLLYLALDENIVAELAKSNNQVPLVILLERLAHRLHDSVGIQKEFATWAVESWALALNVIQHPIPKIASKSAPTTPLPKVTPTVKQVETTAYKVGDILPDGGIVFHVDASGNNGLAAKATDEPWRLKWDDAIIAASAYGSAWHLPTKDELNLLYQQKIVVGGFANDVYWSATEYDSYLAWYQFFCDGVQYYNFNKTSTFTVRAVRAFHQTIPTVASAPVLAAKQLKSVTYKLGDVLPDGSIVFHVDASRSQGLAAKATDEPSRLKWDDAIIAASAYGSGWHLPTKDELNLLYQQKIVVGGFASDFYWSSSEKDATNAVYQYFNGGALFYYDKSSTERVRAVRAFNYSTI